MLFQKGKAESALSLAEQALQAASARYHETNSRDDLRAMTEAAEYVQEKITNLEWQLRKIEHLQAGWLSMDTDGQSRWLTADERNAIPDLLPQAASASSAILVSSALAGSAASSKPALPAAPSDNPAWPAWAAADASAHPAVSASDEPAASYTPAWSAWDESQASASPAWIPGANLEANKGDAEFGASGNRDALLNTLAPATLTNCVASAKPDLPELAASAMSESVTRRGPLYPQTPQSTQAASSARRTKSAARPMKQRVDHPSPEFPMPNRMPPFVAVVLDGEHRVERELDFDWTLHADWAIESSRREERNKLVKAHLLEGKTVAFRSSGNSLYPRVWSGDSCTYQPVANAAEIQLNDVVFCEVQPGNRFFAHVVKDIDWFRGRRCFTIANISGRENGWCYDEHIYGKLIHVEH